MAKKIAGITSVTIVIIVLLMTISLAGGAYLWDLYRGEAPVGTEAPQETPGREIGKIKIEETPIPAPVSAKPIAPGKQVYQVSGKFLGPTISRITIDPQDAAAGQLQKITVDVSDASAVTTVSATVKLDSKSNTFNLKLVSGAATNGVWEADSAFPDDTLFTNYTVTITAISARGTSSPTVTIR